MHRQLVARLESGASNACQLGNHVFDPISRLIDRDEGIDLATYDISEVVLAATGYHAHTALTWPPPLPTTNALCTIAGYPFELVRDIEAKPSATTSRFQRRFKFASFAVRLSDCSDRALICALDPASARSWTEESFPDGTLLDGMSGGPLMHFPETRGVATFVLSGIVVSRFLGVVEARPLSFVRADGTIKKP